MSVKRVMTGSPWHVEKMVRQEGDPRRHRSRCSYYNKLNSHCPKVVGKCVGSAHCIYYEENHAEDVMNVQADVVVHKETFQGEQPGLKEIPAKIRTPKENTLESRIRVIGTKVKHIKYGKGKVKGVTDNNVEIMFDSGKEAIFNIEMCIKNRFLSVV